MSTAFERVPHSRARYPAQVVTNLADPDREPTDEELEALSREAFAGVSAAHDRALLALRARIEEESARVLAALAQRRPPSTR